MKIQVKDGTWFFEADGVPVTVQSGAIDDGEFYVESCNHAGYLTERGTEETIDHEGNLLRKTKVTIQKCDKPNCGAWYDESAQEWVNV